MTVTVLSLRRSASVDALTYSTLSSILVSSRAATRSLRVCRKALEACEERRADRRIEAPCRTYAIGDEIVQEGGAGASD